MLRECNNIPTIVRALEGDKNRKTSILKVKEKTYHFRNPDQIKGAVLLIKCLEDCSIEVGKLLRGMKGKNVKDEVIENAVPIENEEFGNISGT